MLSIKLSFLCKVVNLHEGNSFFCSRRKEKVKELGDEGTRVFHQACYPSKPINLPHCV